MVLIWPSQNAPHPVARSRSFLAASGGLGIHQRSSSLSSSEGGMREGRHQPWEWAEGIGIDSEMEGAVEASRSSVVSKGGTKELSEGDAWGC